MKRTIYTDGLKSIPLDSLATWADFANLQLGNLPATQTDIQAAVAFLYRCVDVRAASLSALPWAIYRGETEVVTDDVDAMPAGFEHLADLNTLLYRTEVALVTGAQAYWLKVRNRVRILDLRWLEPATMEPIWTPQGIGAFKREVNGAITQLPAGDVIYIWLKGTAETTPRPAPAFAAMSAANVLYSMDAFSKAFFDRGAIKGTILQVEGNPPPAEKERVKAWWKRLFGGGIGTAFETEVVSGQLTPIVIGDGVGDLGNSPLTVEKREDIATALGVPHSLVLSNASNYATSEADRLNFYDMTILPQARLIQRQVNEQLFEPLGLRFEFRPEMLPVYQKDENERAASFAAYVGAGVKPSIVAQILGIDLPEGITFDDLDPEPQPMELVAEAQDAQGAQEREEEEARFKRWAAKRKAPDVSAFKSAILSDADKEALLGTGAAPFEWPDGSLTRDAWKALLLQLDPDDDEAERRIRDALDLRSERAIAAAFEQWVDQMLREGMTVEQVQAAVAGLQMPQKARDALQRALIDGVDLGVNVAIDQLGSIGFDFTLASAQARAAATAYGYELIRNIEDTTRRAVGEAVARWVENGEPLSSLVRDLTAAPGAPFNRRRAKLIAQTETTRVYSMGAEASYQESGVVKQVEWRTARDERVCPVCGGNHGKRFPLGSSTKPPAHPGCRCWLAPVIEDDDE